MNRLSFWNKCHTAYDGLNGLEDYRSCLAEAARRLRPGPGRVIFDAGSGTGNLSILLRRSGARAVGMDFSPVAIGLHRRKDPQAEVVQGSLEERLPFEDGVFDGIACLSVLFAISSEGARHAIREFRRVLRPGGVLVVTAMKPGQSKLAALGRNLWRQFRERPFGAFLRESRQMLPSLLRMLYYNFTMYCLSNQGGYHRFTREELEGEIVGTGFVDVRCESTYGGSFYMMQARAPQSPNAGAQMQVAACAVSMP